MSVTLVLAAIAFVAGFAWGYKNPGRYCHQCAIEANAFKNRVSGGLIHGIVFSGIVGIIAYIAFGPGLTPGTGHVPS